MVTHVSGYRVHYNDTIVDVNNLTTTWVFTAPSLLDGVFTDTVVVMVTAFNKFGIGQPSDPKAVEVTGTCLYVAMYVHVYCT